MTKLRFMVTATGTEIGKTYISSLLLDAARREGLSVRAAKPAMSGYSPEALGESDAGRLASACGEILTFHRLSQYCAATFEAPLAPNVAAREAGHDLRFDDLLEFTKAALAEDHDFTLVEGAGGVLSPFTDTHFNADLAIALKLPVVLVSTNYLGAVTHTLTAIESCRARGLEMLAIAVSQPAKDAPSPEPLIEELARWSDLPAIGFPFAPGAIAALEPGANTKALMDHIKTASA